MPTAYHAKYFAHELTMRSPAGDIERLTAALTDSQITSIRTRLIGIAFDKIEVMEIAMREH